MMIDMELEQRGEVGRFQPKLALKGALNQSWEVLLITRVSLMATDEADTLNTTPTQYLCECGGCYLL